MKTREISTLPQVAAPGKTEGSAARRAAAAPRTELPEAGSPADGVALSDRARAELEAAGHEDRKAQEEPQEGEEQDEALRETARLLEEKSRELQQELARPRAEQDTVRVTRLLGDLQGLQQRFDELTGRNLGAAEPLANAARHAAPAPAAGGGPTFGGAPGPGPFMPPPLLGNPYGSMPGGGFPSSGGGFSGGPGPAGGSQQPAPPADPGTPIPNFGKNPSKAEIGQMLEAASKKHGIPPDLLKAVAWQESTWNPRALSFDGQHGKGVMQIDDRFHSFARSPEVFDPGRNIDYGARYLAGLYRETGSWTAALKRYNGGSDYPPKILALAGSRPWSRAA